MTIRLNIAVLFLGVATPWVAATVIRDDATDAQSRALALTMPGPARLSIAGGTGSGTLIDQAWVLTAAHVVTNSAGTPIHPGLITVSINGAPFAAAQVVVHPDWTGINYTAGVDLALVRLHTVVAGVTPATLWTDAAPIGSQITLAGYGAFGYGSTGLVESPGVLRAATNTYDGTGTIRSALWSDTLLLMDFDSPDDPQWNRYGSPTPTPMEGSTASGDSGGGSYVLSEGVWRLAGVHSFSFTTSAGAASPFGYGYGSADVSVAAFAPWINSVIPVPSAGATLGLWVLFRQRRAQRMQRPLRREAQVMR